MAKREVRVVGLAGVDNEKRDACKKCNAAGDQQGMGRVLVRIRAIEVIVIIGLDCRKDWVLARSGIVDFGDTAGLASFGIHQAKEKAAGSCQCDRAKECPPPSRLVARESIRLLLWGFSANRITFELARGNRSRRDGWFLDGFKCRSCWLDWSCLRGLDGRSFRSSLRLCWL